MTDQILQFPLSLAVDEVNRVLSSTKIREIIQKPIDMASLKVIPRRRVTTDCPVVNPERLEVLEGRAYPAGMNQLGAVFARLDGDKTLGLKPGEFDLVCPYCVGETMHSPSPGPWRILPEASLVWVRESWRHNPPCPIHDASDMGVGKPCGTDGCVCTPDVVRYQAAHPEDDGNWRDGATLPRWAARIVRSVFMVDVVRADGADAHNKRAPDGKASWVWEVHIQGGAGV